MQLDSIPHPFPSPYKGEGYLETPAARFYVSERTSKLWRSPIWVQLDSRPHPFPSPYKGEGYRETAAARFYVSERTSYSDRQFGCNYIQYVTTPPRRAGGGKYAHEHLTFLPLSFIRRGVRGEVLRFYVSGLYSPILA